jgi:anti-sigma factor RsiW
MNHQPYERWILDGKDLGETERVELGRHLEGCADCRRLQAGWSEARVELLARPASAPRPGFTQRWKASVNERRLRDQRQQAWKLFLSCSGTAAVLLVFFVAYLLSATTPVEWVQAAVRAISSSVGLVGAVRDVTVTWLQYSPPVVNVVLWITLAVTLCAVTLIWVFAMWRTSLGGAIQR